MFYRIIVWKDKKGKYYYKSYKGYFNEYFVGYQNQYEHEVILIIETKDFVKKKRVKDRVITSLIRLLQKI